MKRLLNKQGLTVMLSCSMALVFTACGSASPEAGSSAAPSAAATASAEKPITLKLATWEQPSNLAALTKINEKFHEKYPNITIKFDTSKPDAAYQTLLQTRLNANDADIVTDFAINAKKDWHKGSAVPSLQQYIDAGLIEDLTGQDFLKNYDAAALKDSMTYKDKVWGVNLGKVTYSGVFYNKDLFEKNGLQVPKTWNEMLAVAQKLQISGVAPFTMAGKDVWPLNMVAGGFLQAIEPDVEGLDKKLWAGEVKFTDPLFTEVLTKYQQMLNYTEKDFMGVDYASVVGRFASGKAAMLPDGIWNASAIEKANPDMKFGYFPMPASDKPENNQTFFGKYDMSLLVAAKSPNKEAAIKYLAFISQPEMYSEFINTAGLLATQPNVTFTNAFLQEMAPAVSGMQLSMENIWQAPQGSGDYGGSTAPVQFLKPAGLESPQEIVQKMQQEWEVEMKNAK